MNLLKLQNISTFYDKIQAIKSIDITVEQGYGCYNPWCKWCWKNNNDEHDCGFLKPKEGSIHYLGKDVTGLRPDQLLRKGLALSSGRTEVFCLP